MAKHLELRFSVGSDKVGALSSIWRVWSNNNSFVMATVRGMHGICKLTMHAKTRDDGGRWCSFGPEEEYYDKRMPELGIERNENRRALFTWQRPEGPVNGIAFALVVVVPRAFLHPQERPPAKPVIWVDLPDEGMAASVGFLFTRAEKLELRNVNQVLAAHPLPNGEAVVICVKHQPFDAAAFKAANEPRLNSSERKFLTAHQFEVGENLRGLFVATPEPSEGHAIVVDVGGLRFVPPNSVDG
jgi:hypothetical protein